MVTKVEKRGRAYVSENDETGTTLLERRTRDYVRGFEDARAKMCMMFAEFLHDYGSDSPDAETQLAEAIAALPQFMQKLATFDTDNVPSHTPKIQRIQEQLSMDRPILLSFDKNRIQISHYSGEYDEVMRKLEEAEFEKDVMFETTSYGTAQKLSAICHRSD